MSPKGGYPSSRRSDATKVITIGEKPGQCWFKMRFGRVFCRCLFHVGDGEIRPRGMATWPKLVKYSTELHMVGSKCVSVGCFGRVYFPREIRNKHRKSERRQLRDAESKDPKRPRASAIGISRGREIVFAHGKRRRIRTGSPGRFSIGGATPIRKDRAGGVASMLRGVPRPARPSRSGGQTSRRRGAITGS